MALTASDTFDLDDHGILRDSFTSDFNFHVDEDGILRDDLDLFKHVVTPAGHGTDSGFGGDKQSSTSTLRHLHASFDDDIAPIGDESIHISDFEASRDDLDSFDAEPEKGRKSKSGKWSKDLDTPGSTLEWPDNDTSRHDTGRRSSRRLPTQPQQRAPKDAELFSEDYYKQLRDLGVLVDGADFSRDESQTEFEALESQASLGRTGEYNEDHRDLITEYLEEEYEREREEELQTEAGEEKEEQFQGRSNSRASSAPTISGRSFPEIAPDEADSVYGDSQQTGDEDEMFLINHRLLPKSAGIHAQKLPVTPTALENGLQNGGFQDVDPREVGSDTLAASQSKRPSSPHADGRLSRSRSGASTPRKPRPDSSASIPQEAGRPQSAASSTGQSGMSKAKSQESFFQNDASPGKASGGEKKRMLPTPSSDNINHSFRVKNKSKSVSNITKTEPLRPTHMSLFEIERMTLDGENGAPDGGGRELSSQLQQESSRRQQATELVQQLQKDYDSLLSKYALAELTIDQMRLGARINLHAEPPTPGSAQPGVLSPRSAGRKAQVVQVAPPAAQRALVGQFSAATGEVQKLSSAQVQTSDPSTGAIATAPLTGVHAAASATNSNTVGSGVNAQAEDRASHKQPMTAESVKLSIQSQATVLNDRLTQFQTLMENDQLNLEEQETAFDLIRSDHDKLRRSYLQAKEDYNVLRRSGATLPDTAFDEDKELEGQLFRLGMQFDELHANVDTNLKEHSVRRQPFSLNASSRDQALDQPDTGQDLRSVTTEGSEDVEFEKRAQHLHQEYRGLMDRYRRLQQMAPSSEQEKETNNLVRKLKGVCNEMPDMFRLAPEIQDRWERLHQQDQRGSPVPHNAAGGSAVTGGRTVATDRHRVQPTLPHTPKRRGGSPVVGNHSLGFYRASGRDNADSQLDDSMRRSPSSVSGSRSSLVSPGDPNSSTAGVGSSPVGGGSRGSLSSVEGAAAPRDDDNYRPNIHRPHRHHHHFRDHKMGKMPERGSFSSLPDSGISDQENRDGRRHRGDHDDALAHLPGPGAMKQMTRQRGENDMDSGFVGSVVSTEGAPPPPPHGNWQPEGPLRLRERPASPSQRRQHRSRLDSSGSTSTVTSTGRDSTTNQRSRKSALKPSPHLLHRSVDRSYEGELDESNVSEVPALAPKGADAPPKVPQGQRRSAEKSASLPPGERKVTKEEGSIRSQRSQSTQEDATLDDVSDEDLTDISTPRHSSNASFPPKELQRDSTLSPLPVHRPPTPLQPSPGQRPPTPYRLEDEEGGGEGCGERVRSEVTRSGDGRELMEQTTPKTAHQQRGEAPRPRSPSPPSAAIQQDRPPSRGRPTTDLYHTRPHPHPHPQRSRSHDRSSVRSSDSSRPESRSQHRRRGSDVTNRRQTVDKDVGSDVEILSDATRGSSVHSNRLRALQEDLERLKAVVQHGHDRPPDPLPTSDPAQPANQGPDWYDPFDDPYGFMRMPRRRANSFSGGRVRDFDEWYWTLPNERRNQDDLPLGYAAADAYNRHYRHKTPETERHRLRRRGDRRRRGEEEGGKSSAGLEAAEGVVRPEVASQVLSAQQETAIRPSDPQTAYNYYVPQRRTDQYQPQGTLTSHPGTHPYQTHAASTSQHPGANPFRQHTTPLPTAQPPSLAATLAGVEPPSYHQTTEKRPWYTIRRSQWGPQNASQQSYAATQPYYVANEPWRGASQPGSQAGSQPGYYAFPGSRVGYRAEACPVCGGTGPHVHEEDLEPVQGYVAYDFASYPEIYRLHGRRRRHEKRGRSRQRSRSLGRSRSLTPAHRSLSRHRYSEMEDSGSFDSDIELNRGRYRSRSVSRSRGHSRSRSLTRSTSNRRGYRRYRRNTELLDSEDEVDLNESLVLSEDISRLTKRMIGTVRGELNRHSRHEASSHW